MRDRNQPSVILELLRASHSWRSISPTWLGAPGGFVEQMPQTDVKFDPDEIECMDLPCSGSPTSGSSLLCNLNRIRRWLHPAKWFMPRATVPPSMHIYVEPGIAYWGGTTDSPVAWLGGTSGSFVHNSGSDPRIDILFFNAATGALGIQQGTPAPIPVPPWPLSGSPFPIAEVYMRPCSGSIFNLCSSGSGANNYIYRDVRPFITAGFAGDGGGGVGTDEKVKVSADDTTADYLLNKLVAGTGPISLTELNDGADEDLQIDWAWGNVVVVAKTGGDYTTVTAALAAITTASATNRFAIFVMPDIGEESVTLKDYVDIIGIGIFATGANAGPTQGLRITGAPVDMAIHNMFLAHSTENDCVNLTGGNVRFLGCKFYNRIVINGSATLEFHDCEMVARNRGNPWIDKAIWFNSAIANFYGCKIDAPSTFNSGALQIFGGTARFYNCKLYSGTTYGIGASGAAVVELYGGQVHCANGDGIYTDDTAAVHLFGGVRVTGGADDLDAQQGGKIYVYEASYDPDNINILGTVNIVGVNRDAVIGDLTVLDDARVDVIDEFTAAAGVTVDELLIKDGVADPNADEFYGRNLIKNSPGQIVVDGAEPQWWDDVANAIITDEDTAGEGIADKHERCFKVVTTADNVYGYQAFTFADEELLDAGQTVVSLGVWVYCASATKASVGIYGTNLGLQESAQVGAGAWELLTVEGITLNAGDASIEVRFVVDTSTAFFTMPMLSAGPKALPWKPRGKELVSRVVSWVLSLTGGDVAWSDLDCTATTDNLAIEIQTMMAIQEPNGTLGSYFSVGHDSAVIGADSQALQQRTQALGIYVHTGPGRLMCDDSQVIRYLKEEIDADADFVTYIGITGYWVWE